jgi:transcriptional regulator GlxA family with amidase domain
LAEIVRTLSVASMASSNVRADTPPMRIGLLLYDGVDVIDTGGPYEVFLTASRLAVRAGDPPPFDVVTLTPDGGPVTAYGGLGLVPQAAASDPHLDLDVVVVPGTIDIEAALDDGALMVAVRSLAAGAHVATSVCTGAFLLGEAGLLVGRPWTTHWEDVDVLAARLAEARSPAGHHIEDDGARRGVRWVDDGDLVTSAGLTSGIAMALHLVDRFAGRELAERTARQLDHPWSPDPAV